MKVEIKTTHTTRKITLAELKALYKERGFLEVYDPKAKEVMIVDSASYYWYAEHRANKTFLLVTSTDVKTRTIKTV